GSDRENRDQEGRHPAQHRLLRIIEGGSAPLYAGMSVNERVVIARCWLGDRAKPIVIPGRCEASNPESRDSGSGANAPSQNDDGGWIAARHSCYPTPSDTLHSSADRLRA